MSIKLTDFKTLEEKCDLILLHLAEKINGHGYEQIGCDSRFFDRGSGPETLFGFYVVNKKKQQISLGRYPDNDLTFSGDFNDPEFFAESVIHTIFDRIAKTKNMELCYAKYFQGKVYLDKELSPEIEEHAELVHSVDLPLYDNKGNKPFENVLIATSDGLFQYGNSTSSHSNVLVFRQGEYKKITLFDVCEAD